MSKIFVDEIKGNTGTTVTVPTGQTLAVAANQTIGGTLTATGAIQGSQFNVGGNKVLEVVSWSLGNDTNKAVNTNYDYNTTLAAGTWLPFVNHDIGMFENHSNANSVGVYYSWSKLGSSSGGSQYGIMTVSVNKWGNGANSYESGGTRVFAPFTLNSSTTIYARWHCQELGTSSNYWVRNYHFGYRFMRIG
tara:strand:+ start:814 stop:1386 length:573 start_codon:yes stop_codon:yes gene_type:complete